jgi:hypothetical protein
MRRASAHTGKIMASNAPCIVRMAIAQKGIVKIIDKRMGIYAIRHKNTSFSPYFAKNFMRYLIITHIGHDRQA